MEGSVGEGDGRTRRAFLVRGGVAVAGAVAGSYARPFDLATVAAAPARAPAAGAVVGNPPLRDPGYWEFADWLQPALDRLWNESHAAYTTDTRINACALMTHAIAALKGHEGRLRRDERARGLAARLCESPPFRVSRSGRPTRHSDPRSESQRHVPGWVSSIARPESQQHLSIDPKVARALYYAWRARAELNLPEETVARMVECVSAVAEAPFFRYPNVRLNQINFAAELHACAASMTGETTLLRRDYRRQLARFLDGAKRPARPWRIPNLGPSYSFHRNPFQRGGAKQNIESAEYANIVLDVIYYYEQARRAGMAPLSAGQARTLRAWVSRALPAYWTHSGYVNWDTGLYLYRWHLSRYWAWCAQGLLAIASSQNFVEEDERRWAKHIFDRSLALYERFTERWDDDRREPGSSLFGITTKFSEGRHFELARFQALAAEAVLRGLGDKPAEEPPPLYAFDPSISRLTITTPSYNTAIVAVSNGAFPYGGIDIARWFDSRQRVISHVGGRAPAGFGLVVRAPNGTIVSASQRPRTARRPGRRPIILTRSPRGPVRTGARYPRTPYAGRFDVLDANGFAERAGVRFRSQYRFGADHIHLAWHVARSRSDVLSAEALFPSWGEATVNVILQTGEATKLVRVPGGSTQIELARVRYFFIEGSEGGYVMVPRAFSPAAVARLLFPSSQSSNPRPGASLALRLAPASHWRELSLRVTMAPARTAEEAAAFVNQL
jgi:hypothetical protein